ncbi:hypothetical protein ACFO6V_09805 [Promicromonospora alba]|uniref:L,D-transpeptidase-like protein n=1 Tax=Promicromonospora alba TaxID=1616110 RepID=A0ABV9HE02_9MICO
MIPIIRRIIAAAASAIALALAASVPAHAAPAPAQAQAQALQTAYDTDLSANAKPEPVARRKPVTVTGTLEVSRGGQWYPLTDQVMAIYFDPAGPVGMSKVGTVRTTSTGTYTNKFAATRTGTWIVKYAGNSRFQPARATDSVCVYAEGRWQCPVSPTNPDLDCDDVRQKVWVGTNDYHGLDGNDNDGWGCESYS